MIGYASWRVLVAFAAAKHGVDIDQILSPYRGRRVTAARTEAIYLVKTHVPKIGLTKLGFYFGRDHTTILTTLRRHTERKDEAKFSTLSPVFTGGPQIPLTGVPVGQDASC